MSGTVTGTVRSFDDGKGLGWITGDGAGGDFRLSHSAIRGTTFGLIKQGHHVTFDVMPGADGPMARNVVRLG